MFLMHPTRDQKRNDSGFTLLELLLVIGISAMVLLGVSQITQSWIQNETAASAGQHLQRVANLTRDFIQANPNAPAAADVLAAGAPWDQLRTILQQNGLLQGGQITSPGGSPLRISYSGTAAKGGTAAIYTTQALRSIGMAMRAARQAGAYGGTLSPQAPGIVRSAFGQWQIPVADLQIGIAPGPRQALLVGVVQFQQPQLVGAYLYRESVAGVADANQMSTDLNMGNNDILNIDRLTANQLNANNASFGDLTVTNNTTFNGDLNVSGNLAANGGMAIQGTSSFNGVVTMNDGTLNAQNINVARVGANEIATNTLQTNALSVSGDMALQGRLDVNGNITARDQITANNVSTTNLDVTGTLNTNQMDVQNTLTISGGTLNVSNAVVDRLVADDCVQIGAVAYRGGAPIAGGC